MFILVEWFVVISIGYLVTVAFHMPLRYGFPIPIRIVGMLAIGSSLLIFRWLALFRNPVDVLVSTYVTFLKLFKRTRVNELARRTEPLVVKGPYRHVRHPLYLSVVLLVLGLWLSFDWTPFAIATVIFLLWFNLVLAPFEERELQIIFGHAYEEYSRRVPRMIPLPRSRGDHEG